MTVPSARRSGQVVPTTVVKPLASCRTHELDGQAVVLDVSTNRLHLLNPTATVLWNRLDGHATVAELSTRLAAEFEAQIDVVVEDVVEALRQMYREGLIDVAGEGHQ